jgi:hypothetical protein
MDDHGEGFDSVQWPREPERDSQDQIPTSFNASNTLPDRTSSRRRSSASNEIQAGENADGVDLAGIGVDGTLECTVDTPLKENDGTKDAYVSYLVTTHVHALFLPSYIHILTLYLDRLQDLRQRRLYCATPLYRLCLSPKFVASRLSCLCCTPVTREEQHGICTRRSIRARLHSAPCLVPPPLHQSMHTPSCPSTCIYSPPLSRDLGLECANAVTAGSE